MSEQEDRLHAEESAQQERWRRYEEEDASAIRVIVEPTFHFTTYQRVTESKAHPQGALNRDIDTVSSIYEEAFRDALGSISTDQVSVERQRYTPPARWRQGGDFGAPWEIVGIIAGSGIGLGVLTNVASNAISKAVITAWRKIVALWRDNDIPLEGRRISSHGPLILVSLCERHARQYHGELAPKGPALWFRVEWDGANAPVSTSTVMVTIPAHNGTLVYVVTDRLVLLQCVHIAPDCTQEIDRRSWALMFEEDPVI
jgi:hypothetical protein